MRIISTGTSSGDDADFLAGALKLLPLFAALSEEQLVKVLYFIKVVEFEAGETVFEEGDAGERFYIVYEGRVEARKVGLLKEKVLSSMGPGEFFGELALLLGRRRAAAIVCVQPTICFSLDQTDLELLMERNPDIADAIRNVARKRFAR